VHSQVQVLAFLKQINNLFVEHPLPLPDRVVASQVHQVHVANVVRASDQLAGRNIRVNRVIDQ
jgi:hypothetical protein